MSIEIPIPSGLTPTEVIADIEAIEAAGLGLLLPADATRLIIAATKLVADAVTLGLSPSAATVLQTETDAEQTAGNVVEDEAYTSKP